MMLPVTAWQPTAAQRLLTTQRANLVAAWPMDDASGTTTMRDASGNSRNGAYSSTTTPTRGQAAIITDEGLCVQFSGTATSATIHSAGLAAAFNGNAGTLLIPCKVTDSTIWTDGAN